MQPRISGLSRRGFNVWRSRVAPSCSQHLHLSWERSEKFSCIQPRHAALIGCISLAGAQARPEQQDRSGVLGRWGAFPAPSLALRAVALPDDAEASRPPLPSKRLTLATLGSPAALKEALELPLPLPRFPLWPL
jgi:hypothetical protein